MKTHREILDQAYGKAMAEIAGGESGVGVDADFEHMVDELVSRAEKNKTAITVVITLLTHKIFDPKQDIRYHQAQLPNGFAGRTVDGLNVTPFMKEKGFPSMAESGWLTRSFEQPHPYTLDYPGRITPQKMKEAFLGLVDAVQCGRVAAEDLLNLFFKRLIVQRDSASVDLAKPHRLSIAKIIALLERHFTFKYSGSGAARLPVLALYAMYECLFKTSSRYAG